MYRICRDFINNNCKRNKCKFIHDNKLCIDFYHNECKKTNCELNHFVDNKLIKNKLIKNTESFEPKYDLPDMRILFEYGKNKTELLITSNDVIVIPDLFTNPDDFSIYNKLLAEIFNTNYDKKELIKPWHGDTHLIVDDHIKWKNECPTFNMIINRVAKYFNMDIKATRFNWYQRKSDWKPFHHDAAAFKPEKALIQNFTVGISFGYTRDIAFQYAKESKNVICIPLHNGYTYCFSKDININWKHGILPIKDTIANVNNNIYNTDGRISIIAWGHINL